MDIGSDGGLDVERQDERELARANLAKRFGIDSAFVRVPLLRKVLGIGGSSIYAQMKAGTFPMPHRRIGNVVVVKFDDLLAWYVDGSTARQAMTEPGPRAPANAKPVEELDCGAPAADANDDHSELAPIARWETAKERAARIKAEAHASVLRKMARR